LLQIVLVLSLKVKAEPKFSCWLGKFHHNAKGHVLTWFDWFNYNKHLVINTAWHSWLSVISYPEMSSVIDRGENSIMPLKRLFCYCAYSTDWLITNLKEYL